MRPPPKDKA